jgi:alkylated DNA repair dioxygenase AlkB
MLLLNTKYKNYYPMLFNLATTNLLPHHGQVYYHGTIFTTTEIERYYQQLLTDIDWRNDENFIYGKKIITKRKVAWYGSQPFAYTYSKTTKLALPFTPLLLQLKNKAEQHSGHTYNSCLLNLYHNGTEGMGWHADAEKELLKDGAIASLSFGAARNFAFKHKATQQTVTVHLETGSLLVMQGQTQSHWQHRLPPTKKILTPRVNLTFRTIIT